jgi:hemolysin activation/secretion protein
VDRFFFLYLNKRFTSKAIFFTLFLFIVLINLPVLSLSEDLPQSSPYPSERKSKLPEFLPETPDEILKPGKYPEKTTQEKLSGTQKIYVKDFVFEGNTVFSEKELKEICLPYMNKELYIEDLDEIRNKLTLHYVEKGYINSGVIIPDQQVSDGKILFKVIEGRLDTIQVNTSGRLRKGYVLSRLKSPDDKPLNMNDLQEKIHLLHLDPRVKKLNASILPGLKPGEAILKADVEEERPYGGEISFSNNQSPSVGSYRGDVSVYHNNLSGLGDVLSLRYSLTEGLDDYYISYEFPHFFVKPTLRLWYEKSNSTVIEFPFEDLDIESETDTLGLYFGYPVYKTPSKELIFSLTGELRENKSFLLGTGFNFSEGAEEGESRITVMRFAQDYVARSQNQALALRSSFNFGIGACDATINNDGPDGRFFSWLGQFQWARRLGNIMNNSYNQFIFKTDLQLATDQLLSMEKFSVGGGSSVRGYRKNFLVRDNGMLSSLEFRAPVWQLKVPRISTEKSDGVLFLCPFYDLGFSWNSKVSTPDPTYISSAGLGLRWDPTENLHTEIYWGYAFRNTDHLDYDIQDDGIHFLLKWNFH